MTARQKQILGLASLLLVACAFYLYHREGRSASRRDTKLSAVEASPTVVNPPLTIPEVTESLEAGLPESHFEQKKRLQEEAKAAAARLEEEKYAGIDFEAERPGPGEAANVEGEGEKALSNEEKSAQLQRLRELIQQRAKRTEQKLEDAKRAGNQDEVTRNETILRRLRLRDAQLAQHLSSLVGEPPPPEAAPAESSVASPP